MLDAGDEARLFCQ